MLVGHRDHWRTIGDHQQNQLAICAYLMRDENGQPVRVLAKANFQFRDMPDTASRGCRNCPQIVETPQNPKRALRRMNAGGWGWIEKPAADRINPHCTQCRSSQGTRLGTPDLELLFYRPNRFDVKQNPPNKTS